jgi:hypothetical protein
MFPASSTYNVGNNRLRDSKSFGKDMLPFSDLIKASHFKYVFFGSLVIVMIFAKAFLGGFITPLAHCVSDIIGVRSLKQMVRIYARSAVTRVANFHSKADSTFGHKETGYVRLYADAVTPFRVPSSGHLSIPSTRAFSGIAASPQPARICLGDLANKPHRSGFVQSHGSQIFRCNKFGLEAPVNKILSCHPLTISTITNNSKQKGIMWQQA